MTTEQSATPLNEATVDWANMQQRAGPSNLQAGSPAGLTGTLARGLADCGRMLNPRLGVAASEGVQLQGGCLSPAAPQLNGVSLGRE